MKFRFMHAQRQHHRVAKMAAVLGYHAVVTMPGSTALKLPASGETGSW